MNGHGIDHVLTFNTDDFKRYTGITVLLPSEVQKNEPQSADASKPEGSHHRGLAPATH
jgi:hypothetical protein